MSTATPVGRYQVEAEIARGGMGVVYRAHDRLAQRHVAYKRLLVPQERQRARLIALFQREYHTLTQLAHPTIVSAYEFGFDEQGPFYTMELLTGGDLAEAGAVPPSEVCRVIRDVASALGLLHARRLLHRDLSPLNVRIEPGGRTKLIDFGALAPFGPVVDVVGTPAFMAPECMTRGSLDQRSDLYALGALAYWALTHTTAVRARSLDDLPGAWSAPIVPPSQLVAGIPPALEELILSLLSVDPLARPASAAEVIERLSVIAELGPEPDEAKVASSYMESPPLVGRGECLTRFEQALHGIPSGGRCFLAEAEQGLGRSALLQQLLVQARLAGATVLHADASAEASPFGLTRSLLRSAFAHLPALNDAKEQESLKELLSPARMRAEGAWSPVQASERQARLLARAHATLVRASAINPLVIVVDDLARADAESMALLATLANDAPKHPLLLVLSAAAGGPRTDALDRIKGTATALELTQLSLAQIKELMDVVFGGAANSQRLAQWLHEQSGGNPARALDLTRLLLAQGQIKYTVGTFALPHNVQTVEGLYSEAALLARLGDLSELAQSAARALSLQQMPIRIEHLARVLEVDEPALVRALEELSARALISVGGGCAALLSSSLGEALADSLPEARRRALHVASAHALLPGAKADGSLRMHAGMHLLRAQEEQAAVALLTARGEGDFLSGTTPIPLLEAVLEVLRRQGRTDAQCLGVLVPLVRGGFFGDLNAQRRHMDATLKALADVCGVTLMARLTPRLGAKLALIIGVTVALFRNAFTPRATRYGSYPETLGALLSILSAATAAFASAYEADRAFEITRMFEPLRAFGPDSAPTLSLEFCLATAEVGSGRFGAARRRYQALLERFERPVQGMTPEVHLQFRQGILHGLAQAKVADTDPDCLRLADELERAHMFFAPHAQTVRMGYYGYRGEMDMCEKHRREGELLALRGGISWSSVTVMTVRSAYMAMTVGDVVMLLRSLPEFERLAGLAPRALLLRDSARACLELLRGRAEQAVTLYEELLAKPEAKHMLNRIADQMFYAKALNAVGRHTSAKRVCEEALAALEPQDTIAMRKYLLQQLALSDAALGDIPGAARRLDEIIEQLAPYGNPLWNGGAHRDRAKVALFAQDHAAFELHARAMTECFQQTRNPALIQQSELLHKTAESLASRGKRALDDAAIAFETNQARLISLDEMAPFQTESLSQPPPANDQDKTTRVDAG